jgi:hypothetical protein
MALPLKMLWTAATLSSEQAQQRKEKDLYENDALSLAGAAQHRVLMPRPFGLMGRTIDSLPTYDKTIIPAPSALG